MQALEKQNRWQMILGLIDFFAVVLGVIIILFMVALLLSLLTWLRQDMLANFSILMDGFKF